MAQVPPLFDVIILEDSHRKFIEWFKFKTASPEHVKKLVKGVKLELRPAIGSTGGMFFGVVKDRCLLASGEIQISFSFDGAVPVELFTNQRTWTVFLVHADINGQRCRTALENFGLSCSEEIVDIILGREDTQKRFVHEKLKKDAIYFGSTDSISSNHGLKLDESQEIAVEMAMSEEPGALVIQGLPGTGKTQVITEIAKRVLTKNPSCKVLVCASSNYAVDKLAVKIHELGLYNVLRVSTGKNAGSPSAEVRPLTLDHRIRQYLPGCAEEATFVNNPRENFLAKKFIREADVICVTCSTAGSGFLDGIEFPFVIVDEATQASELEVLLAIQRGCQKLILVGDPQQLGVTITWPELDGTNWGISLFERLIKLGTCPSTMLDTQYRMHPAIAEPVNKVFYGGQLKTAVEMRELRNCDKLKFLQMPSEPYSNMIFINTDHAHGMVRKEGSLDGGEAAVIAHSLANLLHSGVEVESVGNIALYVNQRDKLMAEIQSHRCMQRYNFNKLMVGSVDTFQGREKNYIFLSSVVSGDNEVEFPENCRRLRVAMSRAKNGVVVFGNEKLLITNETWREILRYYKKLSQKEALLRMGLTGANRYRCTFCACVSGPGETPITSSE